MAEVRPPRPNKDEYQRSMEQFTTEINAIKKKLDAFDIPSKESNSGLLTKKQEARAVFDTLLKQKQAIAQKRALVFTDIKNLQEQIKKKGQDVKSQKDKLRFKTVQEVDERIAYLDKELQKGQYKLIEEKHMVAEISSLKKSRKQIETLGTSNDLEAEKAKLDKNRAQLKVYEDEIKLLDPQITEAKALFNAAGDAVKETFGSVSSLISEKKELQGQLNELKTQKSALYTSFKASQDAWFNFEKLQRKKREEEEKAVRQAEKEARLLAMAEQELEEAEVAAFGAEISLCDALIKFFAVLGQIELPSTEVAKATVVAGRQVSEDASKPARAIVLSRKEDREDDFLVLGNKKNKKQNKRNGSAASKALKMDVEILDQLSTLSVSIPKNATEIAATIEQLQAKKQHFKDNAAAQTEANKKAALAKIEKLREAQEAEEELEEEE